MANTKIQTKKQFHIVYQVTNIINNKIYIGAHSTNDLYDDYCGSGTNISHAITKYGRAAFKKEILFIFNTPQEMFAKEKEIVTIEFIKRADVYNIVEGGYGGANKGSTGLKHIHHPITQERCAVHPNALEKMLQEGWVVGRNFSSTTGTIWINKGNEKKMISPNNLDSFIREGWERGLPKSPTCGKVWIYNPESSEYSLSDNADLSTHLSNGWIKKKWAPIKKGSIWVNNGIDNLRIPKSEINFYINKGWKKGMITSRWL
jgi:hypothetical protein